MVTNISIKLKERFISLNHFSKFLIYLGLYIFGILSFFIFPAISIYEEYKWEFIKMVGKIVFFVSILLLSTGGILYIINRVYIEIKKIIKEAIQ